ncbi:MAG TPA: Hsp20/alpha crystallin family protein [Planctomycetota bacterium]|nr:Hsp20/alpha crystallin family protein [Planctomycetota bacterium]
MNALNRLAPILDIPAVDELLRDVFLGADGALHNFPAINVWKNEDAAIVTAELPGYRGEDIDISLSRDLLTLKGRRRAAVAGEAAVLRAERYEDAFERTVLLPFCVKDKDVQAILRNGILEIRLPRADEDRPRKIRLN